MNKTSTDQEGHQTLQFHTEGDTASRYVGYARRRLLPAIGSAPEPVTEARVRLISSDNPVHPRPARAQVLLNLGGSLVRAQVAGESMSAAIDALRTRLQGQLDRRADNFAKSATPPGRKDLVGNRPVFYHRPLAERTLRPPKEYWIAEATIDQAIEEMELLDHDFFLFVETVTGCDAVVSREPDGSYTYRAIGTVMNPPPSSDRVIASTVAVPRLALEEAVDRIGVTGERFVFFENRDTSRGNVLYRRYDGDYGLVKPIPAERVTPG